VCHAERQAFAHKVICQISCIGKILAYSFTHSIHINGHGFNHVAVNSKRKFQRVNGVKEAFLIFLQIFVVG